MFTYLKRLLRKHTPQYDLTELLGILVQDYQFHYSYGIGCKITIQSYGGTDHTYFRNRATQALLSAIKRELRYINNLPNVQQYISQYWQDSWTDIYTFIQEEIQYYE